MRSQVGDGEIYVVGGVESMSNIPYLVKGARWGLKIRHAQFTDAMWEGLTDPICGQLMGRTAENLVDEFGITRQEQDEFACNSHRKAVAAMDTGKFDAEIVAVEIPQKKGDPLMFAVDEHPRATTLESLARLKGVVRPEGSVTAGNASQISASSGDLSGRWRWQRRYSPGCAACG